MAKLDPTKMKDWEIAEAASEEMHTVQEIAGKLGVEQKELFPYGHYVGKLDYMRILDRLKNKKNLRSLNTIRDRGGT